MAIVLGRKGGGSGGGGGGGSVNEITSTDNSVTITDPSGPTVDLSVSGGSQPNLFGDEPPTVDTLAAPGVLYYATAFGSIWMNTAASDSDPPEWLPVKAIYNDTTDAGVQVSETNIVSMFGDRLEINAAPANPTGGDIMSGLDDPSAGAGVNAPAPSLYMRNNADTTELWIKTGATDTDWTNITP